VAARWTRLAPAATLAVALLVAVPAIAARPHAVHAKRLALSGLESGVLDDLNAIRARHGLARLTIDAALTATAEEHTREEAADGYFAHPSADGTAFWKRIERAYPSAGYEYWSVGENLLWSSPDVDPAQALRLWMDSPEHRANILDPHWREIGVAALHVASAPGTYGGREVTLVTTDFGVRR
jgi:uncharacterized protein YkwD